VATSYFGKLYVAPQFVHLLLETVNLPQLEHFFPLPPLPLLAGFFMIAPHLEHSRPVGVSKKVALPHFGHIFPAIALPP
jgi:hypothetical protein